MYEKTLKVLSKQKKLYTTQKMVHRYLHILHPHFFGQWDRLGKVLLYVLSEYVDDYSCIN